MLNIKALGSIEGIRCFLQVPCSTFSALRSNIPSQLQETFVFSAAVIADANDVKAAKALIAFLRTPEARAAIKAKGMDPAIP